jgi:hypothetical protein
LKSTGAWLNAPELEYPVYLDPSVLFGNFREMGSGYDSFVAQSNPNTNFHSYWNPNHNRFVNYLGNVAVVSNTYARFELNQIAAYEHIRSAYWFGHFEYDGYDNPGYGGHPTYALHKVPSSWGPNTITEPPRVLWRLQSLGGWELCQPKRDIHQSFVNAQSGCLKSIVPSTHQPGQR